MKSVTDYFAQLGTEEYQSSLFKPVHGYHIYKDGWDPYLGDGFSPWSTSETTCTVGTLWQSYQWTAIATSYLHGEWTGSTPWISPSASVPLFSSYSLHPLVGLPQHTYRAGCFARASCWSRHPGKDPTRPCKRGSHIQHTHTNLHSSSIT